MLLSRSIFLALVTFSVCWAQTSAPRKEFEVASIRPSAPPGMATVGIGLHIDGAQVRCVYLSLKDYIGMSYKLRNYQITGPDWIASDRFDINAKLPEGAGAKREDILEMLQTLLESRFQMKFHRESKQFSVYGLVVAKGGLKMQPEKVDEEAAAAATKEGFDVRASGSAAGVSIKVGTGSFNFGNNKLEVRKLTMIGFADMLARFVDRPVIDMTEAKGEYNFSMDIAPEDFRAMTIQSAIAAGVTLPPEALRLLDGASNSSLHTGLQTVGLKLEPRKAPIEVMVIDQAQKVPTEN